MSEPGAKVASDGGPAGRGGARRGVRSFVALPLPDEVRARILAAAQALAPRLPEVKWSRSAENLHLTLKFLGQLDERVLPRLSDALVLALGPRARFELGLRGLGAFPSTQDVQVIWVGVDDPAHALEPIADLVAAVARRFVDGDAGKGGDARTARPFRAHVTVGRTSRRHRERLDATAALAPWSNHFFGAAAVHQVHLYESITGGEASTYILRGTATLEGAIHGDREAGPGNRDQGSN